MKYTCGDHRTFSLVHFQLFAPRRVLGIAGVSIFRLFPKHLLARVSFHIIWSWVKFSSDVGNKIGFSTV